MKKKNLIKLAVLLQLWFFSVCLNAQSSPGIKGPDNVSSGQEYTYKIE